MKINLQNAVVFMVKSYNPNVKKLWIDYGTNFNSKQKSIRRNTNNKNSKLYNDLQYKYFREHGGLKNFYFEIIKSWSASSKEELYDTYNKIKAENYDLLIKERDLKNNGELIESETANIETDDITVDVEPVISPEITDYVKNNSSDNEDDILNKKEQELLEKEFKLIALEKELLERQNKIKNEKDKILEKEQTILEQESKLDKDELINKLERAKLLKEQQNIEDEKIKIHQNLQDKLEQIEEKQKNLEENEINLKMKQDNLKRLEDEISIKMNEEVDTEFLLEELEQKILKDDDVVDKINKFNNELDDKKKKEYKKKLQQIILDKYKPLIGNNTVNFIKMMEKLLKVEDNIIYDTDDALCSESSECCGLDSCDEDANIYDFVDKQFIHINNYDDLNKYFYNKCKNKQNTMWYSMKKNIFETVNKWITDFNKISNKTDKEVKQIMLHDLLENIITKHDKITASLLSTAYYVDDRFRNICNDINIKYKIFNLLYKSVDELENEERQNDFDLTKYNEAKLIVSPTNNLDNFNYFDKLL
jgi:hypothetical protein